MSDDLISRKALIDEIEMSMNFNPHEDSKIALNHRNEHIHFLSIAAKIPTAYDVDAVCKNLDKASDYYEMDEQGKEHVQMVNLTDAIEIVRNGGKK